MPKGVRVGRVSAAQLCRENNWGPGTILEASNWSRTMRITEVLPNWVRLVSFQTTTNQRYSTFPPDVHALEVCPLVALSNSDAPSP